MTMSVLFETNHGSYQLAGEDGETVKTVLDRFQIPLSAVWTYVVDAPEEEADARRISFVPSTVRLGDPWLEARDVHARLTRNINVPGLLGLDARSVREVGEPVTEWTFPSEEGGAFDRVQCQLTAEECIAFVDRSVDSVLAYWPSDMPRRLVVGTSGGGDSNVLLTSLLRRLASADVMPVMMLGLPDWDAQLQNAKDLCASLGVALDVIEGEEAARLAGVRSLEGLIHDFVDSYPDADLDLIGTWLLRRVLSAFAHERGVPAVATGFNREDMVAECLARIVRGLPPLSMPYRSIGETTFVFPMYKVPKKIGDGAYPVFSLENYENRTPSFAPGRSVFYHLAYWLSDLAPGIDVTLLEGFARLADAASDSIVFDPTLADHVPAGAYTDEQRSKWREFLNANLVSA
jgi:tRNA(Ile)-lysidine synthase TilS/MesJ